MPTPQPNSEQALKEYFMALNRKKGRYLEPGAGRGHWNVKKRKPTGK